MKPRLAAMPIRTRLYLVPLALALATALATWLAARQAAATAEREIAARIDAIGRTLAGPPTFRLTTAVLEQIKGLTGADLRVEHRGETITTRPGLLPKLERGISEAIDAEPQIVQAESMSFLRYSLPLPAIHPNAGASVNVYYPMTIRDREVSNAVGPVLWLGIGGGLVATILSAALAFRMARLEKKRVISLVTDGLAHQLRNATSGAKLALQVATQEGEVDRELLSVAGEQLDRVEQVLSHFLDRNRTVALQLVSIDVAIVIDRAVKLESPRALHAGTALTWQRPQREVRRNIDPGQWQHVVANLIHNALDAAGPGGTVDVVLAESSLTIADTGPGPPPALADRVFEAFVTGKPSGLGLGLMVAQQVAQAHGHRLTWHRDHGRTLFVVEF